MTVHELTQVLGELNKPSKPQITEAILLLQSLQPDPLELASIVLLGDDEDLGRWVSNNSHLREALALDHDIAKLRPLKAEIEAERSNLHAKLKTTATEIEDIIKEIGRLTKEREGLSV